MHTATITSKFQLSIPKAIREQMNLKAGNQFVFVQKGNVLYLVPIRNAADLRGVMRGGAETENVSDRKDRV